MAVKFPLKISGSEVRTIEEIQKNFDLNAVVEYYKNGKLLRWLEDRYYDDEAEEIKNISPDDYNLEQKLCEIFDVETPEDVKRRAERLERLKNYTNDEKILAKSDKVAFDQEDLADLLDADTDEIYLCDNRFSIPLRVKNKSYIGISKAVVVIRSDKPVDFNTLGIAFRNISFNPEYAKLLSEENPPKILGNTAEVTTTIINRAGIHEKLASAFVKKASSFKSDIKIQAKNKTADAKNFMMLMMLGLSNGLEITITASGEDSQKAVSELKKFIDSGFTE